MKIVFNDNKVTVLDLAYFDLNHIFSCGQAFRFLRENDGYTGVAFGRVIHIKQQGNSVTLYNTNRSDFERIWVNYFDLNTDYKKIRAALSGDSVLCRAMDFGCGIRILRQDLWECLITFILSQQNNIPRIKGLVDRLCHTYGKPIEFNENIYHTFPSPQDIAKRPIEDLEPVRAGFRTKYIYNTARKVYLGEFSLKELSKMPTDKARNYLMTLKGVGPKVADCVLLFGLGRMDAFPVDVWMKRVIGTLYDEKNFNPDIFGKYSGLAQQYLFFYARENQIGKNVG